MALDPQRTGVDAVDLALVRALQEDGRLTYEALAGRAGLSRAAARARVRRLLDAEVLRIVAVVHPAVQGRSGGAHVAVAVRGAALPVARAVAALPEAVFVTMASGGAAVVAELRAGGFDALSASIATVRALHGVAGVDSLLYSRVLKDPYVSPGEPEPVALDETDRRVLEELQPDGRMPFATLAQRIGLSPGAARARSLRLLEAGVVRVTALVRPGTLGVGQLAGFSLRLPESGDAAARRVAEHAKVQFLATSVGRADAVGTVEAASAAEVLTVLEELRAMAGVHVTGTWLHLEMVKERYDTHLLRDA